MIAPMASPASLARRHPAAERWLAIQRAGAAPRGRAAVEDLVVLLHVRRLLEGKPGAEAASARAELGALASRLVPAAGVDLAAAREPFAFTDLCDRVPFDLCREEPARGSGAAAATPDGRSSGWRRRRRSARRRARAAAARAPCARGCCSPVAPRATRAVRIRPSSATEVEPA
jgi:hypothetical protein